MNRSSRRAQVCWVVHNVVAHPLLVLWPSVGKWMDARTATGPPALPVVMAQRLMGREPPERLTAGEAKAITEAVIREFKRLEVRR